MAVHVAMAKLAGVHKVVRAMLDEVHNRGVVIAQGRKANHFRVGDVRHHFEQVDRLAGYLRQELSLWYSDLHKLPIEPQVKMGAGTDERMDYSRDQLEGLVRYIDQIFEIRAYSEMNEPAPQATVIAAETVFITHGRAPDWREVQAYIERTLKFKTIELAQEVDGGRTIIEKLEANAARCDAAVIVMSGDDADAAGQPRARENVMHEIGYFQAKYGRGRVVLLHEDGVSVPTNLSGIVYSQYPKGKPDAAFGLLTRELNAMYGR